MSSTIDRRKLLKSGMLMAGGLPLVSGLFNSVAARPALNVCYPEIEEYITDEQAVLGAPIEMKARLNANENPFGPSGKAKKAIEDALAKCYQYPFMYTGSLAKKIADFEGLGSENILMAAGSSGLLMAAAIHFSKNPGSNIVTGDPSYEDLPSKATRLNTKWVKVPLTPDYKLDLDAMEKAIDANTSLVYICNPNNPTATVLDIEKLKSFCDRVSSKVTVFIDEAYIDYLDDPRAASMISTVKTGKNIIVARTFSKLYGFAGLRVGYVVAQPDMIRKLSLYTEGANAISATSVQAALVSYQDQDFMKGALEKTMASKNFLYEVLKKEGYTYIPSSTNFVLFPVKMDSQQFLSEMAKRGVGVRKWNFNGKNWCRVSIGRMDEMQAFADAFKEIS
jgi:histidinol-phosphate aminotransferase